MAACFGDATQWLQPGHEELNPLFGHCVSTYRGHGNCSRFLIHARALLRGDLIHHGQWEERQSSIVIPSGSRVRSDETKEHRENKWHSKKQSQLHLRLSSRGGQKQQPLTPHLRRNLLGHHGLVGVQQFLQPHLRFGQQESPETSWRQASWWGGSSWSTAAWQW